MGNSEVGPPQHRRRPRRLPGLHAHRRRDRDGEFARNPVLDDAVDTARASGATLHVLGLLSPGGVHSHERQIAAMVDLAAARRRAARRRARVPRRPRHAAAKRRARRSQFMDARLRAPSPARASRRSAAATTRWTATSAGSASRRPTSCSSTASAPFAAATARSGARRRLRARRDRRIRQADRDRRRRRRATRMRRRRRRRVHELPRRPRAADDARADRSPRSTALRAARVPTLATFVCLTSYGDEFAHLPVAFAPQSITNSFGEVVAEHGPARSCASPRPRNTRTSPTSSTAASRPSIRARTASWCRRRKSRPTTCKPEMSAFEVTDKLVAAIDSGKYDAIVCNYANGDMVGHTGNFEAATRGGRNARRLHRPRRRRGARAPAARC